MFDNTTVVCLLHHLVVELLILGNSTTHHRGREFPFFSVPIPIYLRCHVAVIPKDEADPILQLHIDQDQRRRLHSPPQTERDDDAANLGRLISSQTTLPRVSNIFWFGCCFLQIGKVRAFHNIGGLDIVSVTWENI